MGPTESERDDGNQYVYGAGLTAMKQSGSWYYYLADGLGSTMAVVDASGVVQDSYTYDVYGTPPKTGSLANEFDFAGQQTGSGGIWSWMAWALDDGGRFVVGRCTTAPAFGQHCSPISSPFGPKNAYYER